DTLKYIEVDPIYRKHNHNNLTFSMMYNYSENFILPISHDEVVHGKKSLVDKMWGDYFNKFSGLRMYLAYMMGHPGKKLLFMGSEFGQFIEWREYEQLEWKLIDGYEMHKLTNEYCKNLNRFYKESRALWELDYSNEGFQWIDADNNEQSILLFMRKGKNEKDTLIFICNFTPVVYY
ncbi:MAG: alpha amylase C-terminal domain-containing protein, partial [Cetobacterium sp.]